MHINKRITGEVLDDVVETWKGETGTGLRLIIDGDRTLLQDGENPFPYELIYERPFRRIKVLKSMGDIPDAVGLPSTNVSVVIPPVIHVSGQVNSISYEIKDTRSGNITTSVSNQVNFVTPSGMDDTHVYLIRVVTDTGVYGDWATLKVISKADGFLEISTVNDTLPTEVVVNTEGTFKINALFTTDLPDGAGVRIRIVNTNKITINNWTNLVIGEDIPYVIQGFLGSGSIRYILEDLSGYRSRVNEIHFNSIPNMMANVDGLFHNLPETVTRDSVIPFVWGGVVDDDGDEVLLIVTRIVGGSIDKPEGFAAGVQGLITPNNPSSGSVLVKWRLFDGANYTSEYEYLIMVNTQQPTLDNLVVTVNSVPTEDVIVQPCAMYTLNVSGVTSVLGSDITVKVSGAPTLAFSTSTPAQGEDFELEVLCTTPTDYPTFLSLTFKDSQASITRVVPLAMRPQHGYSSISTHAVFSKPAGVTDMVITSSGGIGEDTTFIGAGLNLVFLGAGSTSATMPNSEERLIVDLPPEPTAYAVNPAEGATVHIAW